MTGTPLILDESVRQNLHALKIRAEANPVDMTTLPDRLKNGEDKIAHMAQMTLQSIQVPMNYSVTFSIETGHPCGSARHMSMSVNREGRAPNEFALWVVAEELGFTGSLGECAVYPEQLRGNIGVAINILQPISKEGQT